MPEIRDNWKYSKNFVTLPNKSTVKCRFCPVEMKYNPGNLVRHLRRKHRQCIIEDESEIINQEADENDSIGESNEKRIKIGLNSSTGNNALWASTASGTESAISSPQNTSANNIDDSSERNEYLRRVMNFLTRCYMPFTFFDEFDIKGWLQPRTTLNNIKLSSETVKTYLQELTDQIRIIIKNRIHNKLLCIKLDSAFEEQRYVLGISIIYIDNMKHKCHTIAVLELNDENVVENLSDVIRMHLKAYNISQNQLFNLSLGNGEYAVKSNKVRQIYHEVGILDSPPGDVCYNYDFVFNELSQDLPVMQYVGDGMINIAQNVYTNYTSEIEKLSKIMKKLSDEFKNKQVEFEMPVTANLPPWLKGYELTKAVLDWRDQEESHPFLDLDWTFIENYQDVFQIIVDFFNKTLSDELTIGDYYREWLFCESRFAEFPSGNLIAETVLKLMKERGRAFFDNIYFLTSLYVDPRFCNKVISFLTDAQQSLAIEQLVRNYSQLKELGHIPASSNIPTTPPNEDGYNALYSMAVENNMLHSKDIKTFEQTVYNLKYRDLVPFTENVLQYFKGLKTGNPTLGAVCEVVMLYPATQTSMENTFKAIPSIVKRTNLKQSPDDLERILLLKFNDYK